MSGDLLLAVDGLSVHVGAHPLLRDVSFRLRPGEALTILGESGAGKSLLAQAVMGNLPPALQARGAVTVAGDTTPAAHAPARRPLWGRSLALLPQEPALALDPLMRIAPQLLETHRLVRGVAPGAAAAAGYHDLETVGLTDAATCYPWQLSGGMAQRAAATVALAGGARILLADEPTKGLDARWRRQAVATMQQVQRLGGCVVVITHDLRVAAAMGGRVIVLQAGQVVEQGDTAHVLARPQHRFTRQLLAADPARWPRRPAPTLGARVLSATGLAKQLGGRPLFEHLDVALNAGDRVVVQGPSGTGKSTLGNVLLGLVPPDRGAVKRAAGLAPTALQKLYQDPVASFPDRVSLGDVLDDVAKRHGRSPADIDRTLERLGVPRDLLARRASQVSGGELQRVALARVLAARPALLFADEPTSRLDPVTQQEAIGVLLDTVDDTGAALLMVTHDDDLATHVGRAFVRLGAEGDRLDSMMPSNTLPDAFTVSHVATPQA